MQFSKVAVFCGSKSGNDPIYEEHATKLGALLGKHQVTMVYGGGKVGIMGFVADAVMQNGGKVTGVIPELLLSWEQQHTGLTDLKIVADMHVRKKMMYELCDAAIILPGGNGTLDELFELITWNTLKIHEKKIFLLNSGGFYDHLIAHLDTMLQQGFLYEDWRHKLTVCDSPEAIFAFWAEDKN